MQGRQTEKRDMESFEDQEEGKGEDGKVKRGGECREDRELYREKREKRLMWYLIRSEYKSRLKYDMLLERR